MILSSADISSMENSLFMQQSVYESIEPTVTGLSAELHEALGVNGDSYQMISSVLGASHVVDNYYKNTVRREVLSLVIWLFLNSIAARIKHVSK